MRKKWVTGAIIASGLLTTIILLVGFIEGTRAVLDPSGISQFDTEKGKEPIIKKDNEKLSIVALGDSLTRGVGDDNGDGYVKRLTTKLTDRYDQKISLSNLSVSGAKTADLLTLLETPGTKHTIKNADLIVMTIGGNDLFPGVETLTTNLSEYKPDTNAFITNSKKMLDIIRSYNSDAPIYWISLYNPFEDFKELGDTSKFVIDWNHQMQSLATQYPNLYIIPVFDLFQGQVKNFLYSDHFHPNKKGYEAISERLIQSIASQEQLGGD